MTITIQQGTKPLKKMFDDIDIGHAFVDKDGDYMLKMESIDDFNAVLLVSSKFGAAGTVFQAMESDIVTPVIFNVTVTPE